MPQRLSRATRLAASLAGTAAMVVGLCLFAGSEPVRAAPGLISGHAAPASHVTQARIYRRGRTPIYPYYYNPGRPGGYSFYFGFVPYSKGQIENQAIQRSLYPQNIEWPPDVPGPRPGWGPKRAD
jgi:hypothetical protein